MQIPILIEQLDHGCFRARAGEPFSLSAEGATAQQAAIELQKALGKLQATGAQIALIEVTNGTTPVTRSALCFPPLPDDDWFFETMRKMIAENRRKEEEDNE